jgi:hypothetical protein
MVLASNVILTWNSFSHPLISGPAFPIERAANSLRVDLDPTVALCCMRTSSISIKKFNVPCLDLVPNSNFHLDILFCCSGPDACFSPMFKFLLIKNLEKLFARQGRQTRAESSHEKMAAA